MNQPLASRLASIALAALMTAGMLGSVSAFAKIETRLGAANAVVAQVGGMVARKS